MSIYDDILRDRSKLRRSTEAGGAWEMSEMVKTEPIKFMSIASKSHAYIAAELADDINSAIYKHADTIPLALAVGVLEVVKSELISAAGKGGEE